MKAHLDDSISHFSYLDVDENVESIKCDDRPGHIGKDGMNRLLRKCLLGSLTKLSTNL